MQNRTLYVRIIGIYNNESNMPIWLGPDDIEIILETINHHRQIKTFKVGVRFSAQNEVEFFQALTESEK